MIGNGKLGCRYLPPGFRLTSCAADPTAEDFAEHLNAFTPADLPPEKRPPLPGTATEVFEDGSSIEVSTNPPPPLSTRQFHHGETAPAIPFCCAKPELEWVGDHDDPEIVCARCGETVAVSPDASRPRRELVYDDVSPSPTSDADPSTDEANFYCCRAAAGMVRQPRCAEHQLLALRLRRRRKRLRLRTVCRRRRANGAPYPTTRISLCRGRRLNRFAHRTRRDPDIFAPRSPLLHATEGSSLADSRRVAGKTPLRVVPWIHRVPASERSVRHV